MSNANKETPEGLSFVRKQEAPTKAPPLTQRGILAWIRENLFNSIFNSILTVLGLIVIVVTVVSAVSWTVETANWLAITFNIRQFMVGRFEPQYEWRVDIAAIFVLIACGAAISVWIKQAVRALFGTIAVVLLVIWLLPPIVYGLVPLPPSVMTAGDVGIQAGTITETPLEQVAFIGQAGERVTIRIAERFSSDEALANLNGFVDFAGNALRNAAQSRLSLIAEQARLQNIVQEHEQSDIPQLTERQYEQFKQRLANIEIPPPVVEQYSLNQIELEIEVLHAVYNETENSYSFEALSAPVMLQTAQDVAQFELPADGWYVLRKSAQSDAGAAVLDASGIYPILQSSSLDQSERVEGASAVGGFVDSFARITDNWRLRQPQPRMEGDDIPFHVITQNQYRGDRPFDDYIRVLVAPFLESIRGGLTILLAAGIAGYAIAEIIRRTSGEAAASRMATYSLISSPFVIWVLVNGVPLPSLIGWLFIFGVVALCIGLYEMGSTLSATQQVALIPTVIVTYAAAVGMALLLELDGTFTGLTLLSILPMSIAAYSGFQAGTVRSRSSRLTGRLIVSLLSVVLIYGGLFIALRADLINLEAQWFLSSTDARLWGGLLLTMMLTIFGIIIAFPIGVGLALGRRSDLPVVSAICTGYIELVRGSPFIAVLFFMQLLIPLINSNLASVPNSYRALVAVVAFSAAYLAENVRGGLQSVPKGQTEAAKALGLSAFQMTILITLPQALRAVIPALVGQFISLFKDTSLVAIVGLTDLTGFVNTMVVQAEFVGTRSEGLFFISVIYFVFSYMMSYVSRLLEASGSGSTRRM